MTAEPKAASAAMRDRRRRAAFGTDRRAGVAVFIALLFPTLIAMGLLAVDAVRAFSQASLVSSATQAAALAGSLNIASYYSQGATKGTTTIGAQAALIGDANMASSTDLSSVIQQTTLGTWDAVHSTFTSLATSGSTAPNAVQVTGLLHVSTFFGGAFGTPTLTITKTATATLSPSKIFNVIVLNDMGGPNTTQNLGSPTTAQAKWWAQQQAADLAIMRCIQSSGNTSSRFGVTGYVEQGYTLLPMTTVNSGTNATTIANAIQNVGSASFLYCRESKAARFCHGSNVAAAIDSAVAQFAKISTTGASNNIVILTNELPLYDPTVGSGQSTPMIYTMAMGTGVTVGPGVGPDGVTLAGTGTSEDALCGSSPVCTSSNLKQMAEGQIAAAGLATGSGGPQLTISVVYFSGDSSTPTGMATSYWNEISAWAKNGGMALTTAVLNDTVSGTTTTPGVATQAAKICQMIGSSIRTASP